MHISLTSQQVRVLHVLNKGGRLTGERTYPHPLNHWLWRKVTAKESGAPTLTRYATPLATATVPGLVALGLVSTAVTDTRYPKHGIADTIDYHLTDAGLDAALQGGELEFDEQWAGDLFGEEAAA